MSWFWHLVVFSALLMPSDCLDVGAVLQLDDCVLENVVTDILTSKDILDKLAKSPYAKKVFGKKGASPVKGISHIKIEDLKFSEISLSLLPGTGIRMSVTNKIEISGKSFLGGKTLMKMEVNIITLTNLTKDNSSCPKFIRDECQTNLINVKANLPKGILPNVMQNFLDKNLKALLPQTLCPTVDVVLSMVNEKLCMKDMSFQIGKSGSVLYLVSQVPTVTEEHIEIELSVTVQQEDNVIKPFEDTTNPIDLPSNAGETSLVLTDEFLGCAFTVLQIEGAFDLLTTENELTEDGAMSTAVLSDILPEFPTELQDLRINISVKKPTMITLDPSKALLHIYSTFTMSTSSSPDLEPQSLFVINLHMNFRIQFSVDEKSLHSDLTLDKIFLSLDSLSVEPFDVEDLKEFIFSLLQEIYTPAINNMVQTAIPLPDMISMLNIDISQATVEVVKNLLVISVKVCKA
ncbi:BPI fold-containing family B member 6 [Pelodytes ibericus]